MNILFRNAIQSWHVVSCSRTTYTWGFSKWSKKWSKWHTNFLYQWYTLWWLLGFRNSFENTHIWVQLRKMSSKIHHSTIAIVSCIVRHSGWLLVVLISSEPCRKTLTVLRHTFQYVTFIFIYNYLIIVAYMIRYQNDSQGEWTTTWAISKEKLQS